MFLKFEWAENLNTSSPEETYRCPTSKQKTLTASASIVRAEGKLAPPPGLVGMPNSAATLEHSLAGPHKGNCDHVTQQFCSQGRAQGRAHAELSPGVHSSTGPNSQMSIPESRAAQCCPPTETTFSHRKEWSLTANMDEPQAAG